MPAKIDKAHASHQVGKSNLDSNITKLGTVKSSAQMSPGLKPPSKKARTSDATQVMSAQQQPLDLETKATQPAIPRKTKTDTCGSVSRDSNVRVIVFGSRLLPRQRKNSKKKSRVASKPAKVASKTETDTIFDYGLPSAASTPPAQSGTNGLDGLSEIQNDLQLDKTKVGDNMFTTGDELGNNDGLEDDQTIGYDMQLGLDEDDFHEHIPSLSNSRKGMGDDLTDLFSDGFDIFR